jgi:hypothetical protein
LRGGPGPDWPRDTDDVGFVSCSIKVMGVPGPEPLDDEKLTQYFLSICTPTFITPVTRENAKLQALDPQGHAAFLLHKSAGLARLGRIHTVTVEQD